jgi:predicted lipoprotein
LFLGGSSGGLTELVRAVAPEIDESVRAAFVGARERVDALRQPLERVVLSDPDALAQAAAAAKRLELALKVDTTNALGITLTFQSGDGD